MEPLPTDSVSSLYALEHVPCYQCHSEESLPFMTGQDDLTGKPGNFHFVSCRQCGLVYQNPRIASEQIKEFYDQEYIAHRRKANWGILTRFYKHAMEKHDRDKHKIIQRQIQLNEKSQVLDVGCAVGTFLGYLKKLYNCSVTGIDFKDLAAENDAQGANFHCGLFYEIDLPESSFDLVTMWHFLEHDYDPVRSLDTAKRVLKDDGLLVIEVPRLDSQSFRMFGDRWPGLQAPQHTVLFDKAHFIRMVEQRGFEVVEYLPWGAFPAYFYMFAGCLFKMRKGKGVNLGKAIYPYYLGQLLTKPIFLFEKKINLAMQTLICRKSVSH